jgi:hypothetical protein
LISVGTSAGSSMGGILPRLFAADERGHSGGDHRAL